MGTFSTWMVIPAAFFMDLIIGDPRRMPHPVRWMGSAIAKTEPFFRKRFSSQIVGGALFAVSLIFLTWALAVLLVAAARCLHPVCAFVLETLLLFYCFSVRSLETEAMGVFLHLVSGRLPAAREKLRYIVGRDVAHLDASEVSRAAVETVAENFSDGFLAPLFYAVLGGAPLALAYKMINTLDSMVGYENESYRLFGKAAARLDDAANFIPARLSVPVIALAAKILTGRGVNVLAVALREGHHHKSPNAGYPEAAFAGALRVKLGGPNVYHGRIAEKPHIGKAFADVKSLHIPRACDLMLLASFLSTLLLSVVLFP